MEKRSMTKTQEYAELTKRYDRLIQEGASFDEARIVGIRMSALQLEVAREQEEQMANDYLKGYQKGFKEGHAQGIKDCQVYTEEEERIIVE